MTLYELVKHLRRSILDDVGGHGIAWEDIEEDQEEAILLRWTNEELTDFINEALRKVCRSTYLLRDLQPSFKITIIPDNYVYNLDSRIIRIKNTKLISSGLPLEEKELEDIETISNWEETSGTPTCYIVDYQIGQIAFYPNPSVGDTLNIWAIREELNPLVWTSNTSSPEIPKRFHIPMLNYAAHLAYLKAEANTLDPDASGRYLAMFQQDFDNNSAYTETRRHRSRGRTVKYGGL